MRSDAVQSPSRLRPGGRTPGAGSAWVPVRCGRCGDVVALLDERVVPWPYRSLIRSALSDTIVVPIVCRACAPANLEGGVR